MHGSGAAAPTQQAEQELAAFLREGRVSIPGRPFEDEVRYVARQLWPEGRYAGSMRLGVNELDGVFDEEFVTHLIEATTLPKKDKAEQDCAKLAYWRSQYGKRGRHAECWFVTLSEPTVDQRQVAKKHNVYAVSYASFRQKLVDVPGYLTRRDSYRFGSSEDPAAAGLPRPPKRSELYVSRRVTRVHGSGPAGLEADLIAGLIENGHRVVVIGDYGVGKSVILQRIYEAVARSVRSATRAGAFAVHLNLRDHHGQTDPVEALIRHATRIGFDRGVDLVSAWRAGFVHVILDGFDELAGSTWAGSPLRLRNVRYRTMELVRTFIRETPIGCGVLVAGREHYFSSMAELVNALGLQSRDTVFSVGEFNEQQATEYLRSHGWTEGIPDWLPMRPLLLGYLAARNLLEEALAVPHGTPAAVAWDRLLNLICMREADLEANLDGDTLRRVLERLASLARRGQEELVPLTLDEIRAVFRDAIGGPLDERAEVVLQRMPGMGSSDEPSDDDGSENVITKRFVDTDLADSAAAGEVSRYVLQPHDPTLAGREQWTTPLGSLGIAVAAHQLTETKVTAAQLSNAIQQADRDVPGSQLPLDIARIAVERGDKLTGKRTIVSSLYVQELSLDNSEAGIRLIEIWDSVIARLDLPPDGIPDTGLPTFVRCYIASLNGRSSDKDLPDGHFVDCEIAEYAGTDLTTSALMGLPIPIPSRVALTVLKKIHMQKGGGRRESALYKGLSERERPLVTDILPILASEGLATVVKIGSQRIWVPARSAGGRVREIMAAPARSTDPFMEKVRKLT